MNACLAALIAVALTAGGQHDHDADHKHDAEESRVTLSADERAEFGVEVEAAGPGHIELYVSLPAEVHANADRLAHIVPRFSGIVTAVHVNLGDRVSKGQSLATIESDESLAPFDVKTLIPGTVIAKHIALGEAVTREKDIFVIADLTTVWMDVTLYQRDLERVRVGQQVTMYIGHDESADTGTISYITPVVSEATRTATARVVLDNTANRWRPGMFVTARVVVENADVGLAVPRTALQTIDDETIVFVEEGDAFVARPVATGRAGEHLVEITAGLEPGERYVARGGFILKAELGKESFGHGHAH